MVKSQFLSALTGKLWFVHEQKMHEVLALGELLTHAGGEGAAPALNAARVEASRAANLLGESGASVAVIPIHGMITQRGSVFSYFFGGSSTEELTQQLRQAVADPQVAAIVLDIDSPGGDVNGVDELASEIYQARKTKPVTAVSNTLMASAAYYLGSQASELLVSPSSLTGSIGVYTLHEDDSEMLANMGIKISMIKYGENKGEGNPFAPLDDPARQHMQEMVDTYGSQFESAVARGRGKTRDEVHGKFGQGRLFDAKKAVKLGLADRVGTLDDALAKHGARRMMNGTGGRMLALLASEAQAAETKTKRVDDEDLEKSAFAYQGSEKTEDWKLPIEFSTKEKTVSHIEKAIQRWPKTAMPDKAEKDKARERIKAAAKEHDVEVGEDSLAEADPGAQAAGAARRRRLLLMEV